MIVTAFFRALAQMSDSRFRGVLLRGVGLAALGLFAFFACFVWGLGWLVGDVVTLPWIGEVTWVDDVVSWTAIPLMLVLSVFLMVPVASAITSLFLEDVAQAVEDRHYPALGPAQPISIGDQARDTLAFLGVLLLANAVAVVIYVSVPLLAPFVFWAVNGFLLGREYFTLAAMRRVGRREAAVLRKRHMPTVWAAGVLMALPLTVPVVNLLVPVLGAATFTHIFHRLEARRAGA